MSAPTLSPSRNSPKPTPKGQLVTLGIPLFVLKARFTGPDGKEMPLPKHRWTLVGTKAGAPAVAHLGTQSDADGVSSIPPSEDLGDPDMSWHLSWQPSFETFDDLLDWTVNKEAWLDLDKKPTDKDVWVPVARLQPVEHRRLLRMPVWTSRLKAQNGQFKDSPTDGFKTTGALTADDINAKLKAKDTFGTRAKPWVIFVDHQWYRTFLHFRFYDFKKKDESVVPPGLVVRARRGGGAACGGGTAWDLDGTIFVLHDRTKDDATKDVDYAFLLSPTVDDDNPIIDLDAAAPSGSAPSAPGADKRMVMVKQIPEGGPPKRYLLPKEWTSHAMQGFLEGASPRARKDFASLRAEDTTQDKPLAFHLDDVLLYDMAASKKSSLPADSRVVLFDHRLGFRGPFDDLFVHMLKEKLTGPYLRAEDLMVKKGDAFADSTFVINHEGDFFVLREQRVMRNIGDLGDDFVGARMAAARAAQNPIGNFLNGYPNVAGAGTVELHFLPDAYDGPYDEAKEGKFFKDHPKAKLCHVLINVPLQVQPTVVGPKSYQAPTANDLVQMANMNSVYQALIDAAARWDQAHPADGATGKKDYVITPDAGVKDDTRVVKLRHYFGVRTDNQHKFTILATYRNQLDATGARSFVWSDPPIGALMSLVVSPRPPAKAAWTIDTDTGQDSDGVNLPWFTLAHELGHTMGLPDEYGEGLAIPAAPAGSPAPKIFAEPRAIRFGQAHEGYPFYADFNGMMRDNKLPRLRYVWHHIDAFLNNGPAKAGLPEGPYSAQAPAFARGTTHRIPDGNATQPWGALGQAPGPAGRSTLVLYRAGDDEATVEAMFPRPASVATTPGAWLQGILLVSSKIWFNFLPSAAGDFPNHAARFGYLQAFFKTLYDGTMKPQQRFIVEGDASLRLPRIGILFQPRLEFGPVPQPLNGFQPPNATEANADVVVDIVFQSGPPPLKNAILPPGWPPSAKPRLTIGQAGVGLSILRSSLGIGPPINNGAIQAAELAALAPIVATMLADPPASPARTVKVMPT
jgi:hypothetical protein